MRVVAVVLIALAAGCGSPPAPSPLAAVPLDLPGLHNVFRVTDRVYSGSSPDGDAGFRSLQQLGVKSIVSVDGATPDAAAARRFGMRYAHLPLGYDGVPGDKACEVAKAVRDLPGPVYVHCHHGKHRGPAAVVAAVRCLDGRCTADAAVAFLKQAGTDPRYAGLYAAAEREPTPPDAAPGTFPEAAAVPDLVARMVAIDERWDALKAANAAGWPATAIDDAVQLREHYREAARFTADRGDAFRRRLGDAEAAAGELAAAVRSRRDAGPAFRASGQACTACHAAHRD